MDAIIVCKWLLRSSSVLTRQLNHAINLLCLVPYRKDLIGEDPQGLAALTVAFNDAAGRLEGPVAVAEDSG